MSINDPSLYCDELIPIAQELVQKLKITNPIPDDFEITNYPQDIAEIRHTNTNYEELLYELQAFQLPASFDQIPTQYVTCGCIGEECVSEQYAYSIIKHAANELAKQLYRDL